MKTGLKIQGFPAKSKKVNRMLGQNVKFDVKW